MARSIPPWVTNHEWTREVPPGWWFSTRRYDGRLEIKLTARNAADDNASLHAMIAIPFIALDASKVDRGTQMAYLRARLVREIKEALALTAMPPASDALH